MPQKGAKGKVRPEISNPILIKSKSEDHSVKLVIPKPKSDADLEKLCEIYENKIFPLTSAVERKDNDKRRDLCGNILESEKDKFVGFSSMSEKPQYDVTKSGNRKTIYDEGDYVMLEFPFGEQGKFIRADPKSGKFELRTKEKVALKRSLSQNEEQKSLPECSNSSNTLPRTNRLELLRPRIPSKPAVDDEGYEAPLIFQAPEYMSLDFVSLSISSKPSTTENAGKPAELINQTKDNITNTKQKHRKEVAQKQFQKTTLSLEEEANSSSNSENLRKPKKPSFLYSFSGESSVNNFDDDTSKIENINKHSRSTPINSFLAARLETTSLKSNDDVKNRTISAESWPSTTLSSPFSDPENDFCGYDSEEWSDSNSFSSDSDCYYHLIEPPDLSGHTSDHDYAIIDDCNLCKSPRLKRKKAKRSKSVKKAISLVVNGRSKSTESNKSPHTTPKLQRSNMQDMRTTEASSSTWDTVSTPGILKLDNFKDLGKNS